MKTKILHYFENTNEITQNINALSGLFHNEFKLRLGLFLIKE